MQTYANVFPDFVKLIEYLSPVVIVVLSKPDVGPATRIKIFLFLLSICTEELLSTPN